MIGKLVAKDEGADGCDIYGQVIPRKRIPADLTVGDGVQLAEDGTDVMTLRDGKVEITDGVISVVPCRWVEGDVTADVGNIQSEGSIRITGTVCGAVRVESDKSITIDGAIDKAAVSAKHHVVVGHGIRGPHQAEVAAGGHIVARYCENVTLRSAGDVRMLTSAYNAKINSRGKTVIAEGMLKGGMCYARCGLVAKTIGSEAGERTTIWVGIHPQVLCLLAEGDAEIQTKLKAADRIRQTVTPLTANMKRLTPEQRERATELLYQADSIEAEIETIRAKQKQLMHPDVHRDQEKPSIEVESRIYHGTIIYLGGHKVEIKSELRGPVTITLQEDAGKAKVVALNKGIPMSIGTEKHLAAKKLSIEELRKEADQLARKGYEESHPRSTT